MAKSVRVRDDISERLSKLSKTSGIPMSSLSDQLLSFALGVLEAGGKMTVDINTGDVQLNPPLPVARVPVAPKAKVEAMTQNPNQAREINLKGG